MTANTGQNLGPDLEGLNDFIDERDRNRARFFVGREKQIADVEGICDLALRRFREGSALAGSTLLIQGAPGAGKTALLKYLEERWSRFGSGQPMALIVDRRRLANPTSLAFDIAECLDPEKAKVFRQATTHGRQANLGVGPAGITGTRTTATAPPSADFSELRRLFPTEAWERPLCLMIDEIQNLEPEQGTTLESLHLASDGLPVVPLLAGLSNAQEALARHGRISRLASDAVCTLGCLEAGQPADAVLQMLDSFCVEAKPADAECWARLLERASDGWPQHLQNGMRALAEGLVAVGGKLDAVDKAAVLARTREWREAAYRARKSDEMRGAAFLVGSVMASVPDNGLNRHEIIDLIQACSAHVGGSGWKLPEGMSAVKFLDHLVSRGALQRRGDDRLACPIPSFRRFLMQDAPNANGPESDKPE